MSNIPNQSIVSEKEIEYNHPRNCEEQVEYVGQDVDQTDAIGQCKDEQKEQEHLQNEKNQIQLHDEFDELQDDDDYLTQ